MQIRDAQAWAKWVENNTDGYGKAVIDYAERWASLMEDRMAGNPSRLPSVAEAASHDADTEGITGFMYGAAVAVLATTWEHGEALRRWHNLETQIGHEGERANEHGGVLNPALLNLSD